MTTSLKIRWLYLALSFCLFLTAIIARRSYNSSDKLAYWASHFEDKLHDKEAYTNNLFHSPATWKLLQKLDRNTHLALSFTREFRQKNIAVITYRHNRPVYWSMLKIVPKNASGFKNGRSFIHYVNGYYDLVRKTEGDFTVLAFIPVKTQYALENEYLPRSISPDLSGENNIDIAGKNERNTVSIHSADNQFLFKVKLLREYNGGFFSRLEMLCCFLGILFLCAFINAVCRQMAINGKVWMASGVLLIFIIVFRLINIRLEMPDMSIDFELFKPVKYADGSYGIASLGDFIVNIILLAWLAIFLHRYRDNLVRTAPGKTKSYVLLAVCIVVILGLATYFSRIFHSLIINSSINFDVNNVLHLTYHSIIGALALCFAVLVFYLLSETVLTVCLSFNISFKIVCSVYVVSVIGVTMLSFLQHDFTIYYILISCVIAVQAYNLFYHSGRLTPSALLIILFLLSTITALKLAQYQQEKEKVIRKKLAQTLARPDDPEAAYRIASVEKKIAGDPTVISYFRNPGSNQELIKNHLKKIYFEGFFPKYNVDFYYFNADKISLSDTNKFALNDFRSAALFGSVKVTTFFYRTNDVFGYHNYFALVPVKKGGVSLGTLVIDMKSKPIEDTDSFPDLLIDKSFKTDPTVKDYSYAFYNDGKLISQNGDFVYSLFNTQYKGFINRYTYCDNEGYNHLIYQITDRKLLVISKQQITFFDRIASLTFFFIFFLAFAILLLLAKWLAKRFRAFRFNFRNIRWSFLLSTNKILYKTRIQTSIILSVVITLLVAGFITYLSIGRQYDQQQNDIIRDKVKRLAEEVEGELFKNGTVETNADGQLRFYNFANTYSTDLTLYDLNGIPILTTQPKIYDYGFIARRISPYAYLYLYKLHKSEYIYSDESIGKLRFKAGYAPVKNAKNEVVAFLQIPYFANQSDYNERIGAFLNTLINVYALIFLAIGLFAVFLANQITSPLTIIQQNLSRISYGKKNEPISWKRNDEIGSLIKEYNNMLAELEESARKLGESERQGAWREMAKQVAHEIKNPLTPMKLGLQLLEKSWREKDPNFDAKFERFSKSFIEQIESLAFIATEFSNFAKMPETKTEAVKLDDLLRNAVNVFMQNDRAYIHFTEPHEGYFFVSADKDQLLRCFNNLLKNAIEAIPKNNKGKVEIHLTQDEKQVHVSIKDNGSGIPNRISRKIFEPNFTTKSSGTGLGLAFVKNAVENMGGSIRFETEMYFGTTFYISLPK